MTEFKKLVHTFKFVFYFVLFFQLIGLSSCNKSNSLGADLLSSEWINAIGMDTFSFQMSSYVQDSILLASAGFPTTFFVGKVNDPVFGSYDAELYSQLNFAVTKETLFLSGKIDSVVFSMRYDTSSFFGNTSELQNIRVFPLIDTLDISTPYYTGFKRKYDPTNELGSLINFKPNLTDSVKYKFKGIDYSVFPQLRFTLDTGKFMGLMRSFNDTVFNDLTAFNKAFPGIAIVADKPSSLMAFLTSQIESNITVFYRTKEDTISQFNFYFGPTRVSTNRIDNTGSKVEDYNKNVVSGDSISFIQGFGGPDLRIKIPYQQSWSNRLLNYAVLEITSPMVVGDNTSYYKRPQDLIIKDLSLGKPINNIIDASFGLSFNNLTDYHTYFGGNPKLITVNGEEVFQYKFNITGHFLEAKRAKRDIDMIISPLLKSQRANRLIINGNKNTKHPAKLRLVFSD